MAARSGGRGRDISISLSTDLSRFDPDAASDGLEDLSDAASDAGRDLRDLASDADRTGSSLDQVGDGADRAARDTDESMGEIRETSKGAANEIAAGFDGSFESVIGGLQGMVSEFGMALGPAGMVGLMAGAAAIGAVYSRVSETAEEAEERISGLRDRMRELADAGMDQADVDMLRSYVDELDSAELGRLATDAEHLGLGIETIARARYGEADAIAEVTSRQRELGDQGTALDRWLEDHLGLQDDVVVGGLTLIDVYQDQSLATRSLADETAKAAEGEAHRADILGGLTDAQIELNEALQDTAASIVDASDDVESAATASTDSVIAAAKAQAEATQDMADTWADYAGASSKAADEIIAEQERQLTKLTEFQANTQRALEQSGQDLVAWANEQDDAPAAMAAAAKMTPEQGRQIGENYRRTVELAGEDLLTGTQTALDKTAPPAKEAGKKAGKAFVDGAVEEMSSSTTKKRLAEAGAFSGSGGTWMSDRDKRIP